jgi:hypothetical protein
MITSEQTWLELGPSLENTRLLRRIKHVKSESRESYPNAVSQNPEPLNSSERNVPAAS